MFIFVPDSRRTLLLYTFRSKIKDFVDEWHQKRPLSGGVHHSEIQDVLSRFESQMTTLEEEVCRITVEEQAFCFATDTGLRG